MRPLTQTLAASIATGLGSGKLRPAPGTWGSFAAAGFILTLDFNGVLEWELITVWLLIFIVGCWAAGQYDHQTGKADNQSIVIDEWLGMAVTTAMFEKTWMTLFLGFLLFRIFDIFKIYPVRNLDRWSKKLAQGKASLWLRGFGVIVDDLVAGVQAAIALTLLEKLLFS